MRSTVSASAFARHPAESFMGFTVGEHHARIVFSDAGDQADGVGQVGRFCGHDEGGVHLDGHGQLVAGAIVDDAAARREFEAALLLVLGAALEVAVTENLKIDEAQADDNEPQAEESGEKVEPEARVIGRGVAADTSVPQFSVRSSQ